MFGRWIAESHRHLNFGVAEDLAQGGDVSPGLYVSCGKCVMKIMKSEAFDLRAMTGRF
jgi:hypothetical protein